ncbi:hypothetical protein FHS66_003262 [Pacificitalea manganoxidans]|jgi:hypothetical protein|uniref:Uncharacterized protein n=1 Tax=Actibacterium naphthalenivorans TaxID=1614693 RepID=A0A840CER6_9RHOB|nr:hypothetical protein [Actibacterium naphthalenivorans]MDR6310033.1 hypothetical protein [Pacificitalea manganoxidans]
MFKETLTEHDDVIGLVCAITRTGMGSIRATGSF